LGYGLLLIVMARLCAIGTCASKSSSGKSRGFAMWLKSDAKTPFPVLTDMDNGYAMSPGLAIYVGDELKDMMVRSGWDPSVSHGTELDAAIPASFVIGTDGIVQVRLSTPITGFA
jgi:hypothetical protein